MPGSVGHCGQEEAVCLGVARVLERGWVRRRVELCRRARPHHTGLELGLIERRDARRHGAAGVPQHDVGCVGSPRPHSPLVDLRRGHASHGQHAAVGSVFALTLCNQRTLRYFCARVILGGRP